MTEEELYKITTDGTVQEFHEHLERLRERDIQNQEFLIFKKNHSLAAEQLDDKINNFYNASLNSTISRIKLPEPVRNEITYYNFISERMDEVEFANKLDLIQAKLEEFDSPFATYIDTMRWKIENGYVELKGRDWLTEFFSKWTFMLSKRILDFRLKEVEDLRYNFLIDIHSLIKNYTKYAKVYKTFYDVFGKTAIIDDELKNQNIEAIARFADFFLKDPSILKIVEMLGRLNGEDDKYEINITEQIVTYPSEVKLPYNPEEIVGVRMSKDIEHALPMELAMLFDDDFELIFFKKFVEGQLTTFLFESKETIIEHDVEEVEHEAPIPIQQGKFIICIDTSSSMEGAGEYIAKSLAIAVVKVALKEFRDIVIINFANREINEFMINGRNLNLSSFIEFMSKSFYGSTNATPAFERAINKMHKEEFKRADFLMISDFMLDSPGNKIREKIADLKENYNRFHSLVVGTMPNIESQDIFDNVMYYDPNDPYATQQIVKSLNDTLKNLRELKDEEVDFRNEQIRKMNELRDKKSHRKVVTDAKKEKIDKLVKIKREKLEKELARLEGNE